MYRRGLLVLVLPSLAFAAGPKGKKDEERAPDEVVYSEQEITRTRFKCHFITDEKMEEFSPQPTNFIKCEFTSLSVWGPDNPDEAAAKAAREWDAALAKVTEKDRKGFAAEITELVKKECSKPGEIAKLRDEKLARIRKHPMFAALENGAAGGTLEEAQAFCRCPDFLSCTRANSIKQAREMASRCSLVAQTYSQTFHRDFHNGGWTGINTHEICYASITYTLTAVPSALKGFLNWDLHLTKVPRGPEQKGFCAGTKLLELTATHEPWGDWIEPPCRQFKYW